MFKALLSEQLDLIKAVSEIDLTYLIPEDKLWVLDMLNIKIDSLDCNTIAQYGLKVQVKQF